ncbi:hypothetical protein PybrP1_006894, partial [[Pythium] brassicae (nom. inval.)]
MLFPAKDKSLMKQLWATHEYIAAIKAALSNAKIANVKSDNAADNEIAKDFSLDPSLLVGRQTRCWMRLTKDLEISSLHAEFRVSCPGSGYGDLSVQLRDLQSTNGTKLNGEPLAPQRDYALADQDLVLFGKSAVRFRVAKAAKQSELAVAVQNRSSAGDGALRNGDTLELQHETQQAGTFAREPTANEGLTTFASETSADTTCMICGHWLGHLDVLEQQLHINSCLDGNPGSLADDGWHFLQQQHQSQPSTATTRGNGRRKRKRAFGDEGGDPEVVMAVALSKSITSREQEMDMDIALLSGELAQIDSQMAKLAKKRDVLLKRMAKLEKTKAKVKQSAVLLPAEARVLLDLTKALR